MSGVRAPNFRLLLALVAIFVVLIVVGIVDTGVRHVNVVVNNIFLGEQNDSLRFQVARLEQAVQDTTSHLKAADSLVDVLIVQDSILEVISSQLDDANQRIENERRNSIISPYNTSPYRMDSVELPGAEDN